MGFKDLRTPDKWMAGITAVLLAGYFVFLVYTVAAPSAYDPQQGMAVGFLSFLAFILLLLGGALWFGVARKHPWVIRTLFAIAIFPVLSQTAQEIFLLVHRAR
jgi:hypothetical protein